MDSANEFKKLIQSAKPNPRFFDDDIIDNNSKTAKKEITNKEVLKNPKTNGIATKYLIHLAKIAFCLIILIGMIVWNVLADKKSVNSFQKTQAQIYFTDSLKVRAYLSETVSQELLSAPPYALVENIPLETWVEDSLEEIPGLRAEAQDIYLNEDGSYDPQIENIMYVDGCSPLPVDSFYFCAVLQSKGIKTGLIYLLTYLEQAIQDRLEKYQSSDGSEQALRDIEALHFEYALSLTMVTTAQCTLIREIISNKLNISIIDSHNERKVNLGIFTGVLLLVALFVWYQSLNSLRNTFNDFKNVLRALPAQLVLSSFILKSFLLKNSNGALDFVKNEI